MNIWRLLSALVITVLLVMAMPYVLRIFGLIPGVAPRAWITLGLTAVYLVVKLVLGDFASGEFAYHKHGYDFCILTVGGALTSLSLQLMSKSDLFAGLPQTGFLSLFAAVSGDVYIQHVALLVVIFLLGLVFTLISASIVRALKDPNTKLASTLKLISYFLGVGAFGAYIFTLVARG